jgi:hypothetical protein
MENGRWKMHTAWATAGISVNTTALLATNPGGCGAKTKFLEADIWIANAVLSDEDSVDSETTAPLNAGV